MTHNNLIEILKSVAKYGFKNGKINMVIIIKAKNDILSLIPHKKECNPGYNQCVEDTHESLNGGTYEK